MKVSSHNNFSVKSSSATKFSVEENSSLASNINNELINDYVELSFRSEQNKIPCKILKNADKETAC